MDWLTWMQQGNGEARLTGSKGGVMMVVINGKG
jgi:hypothetical protein